MTVTVSSAPAGTITVQPGDRTPASIVIKNYNIENVTTSEIPEGGNLYFSNARVRTAISAGDASILYNDSTGSIRANVAYLSGNINISTLATTGDIAESGNLYFTNARVYSNVTQLNYITSSALSGYATNAQAATYATAAGVTSNIASKANVADLKTANVAELTNLYFTNARAIAALTAGQSITIDANGRVNSSVTSSGSSTYGDSNVALLGYATNANVSLKANTASLTTANVTELTNLYFTNARARTAISVTGSGSYDNSTGVITVSQSSTYGDTNTYANVSLINFITGSNITIDGGDPTIAFTTTDIVFDGGTP